MQQLTEDHLLPVCYSRFILSIVTKWVSVQVRLCRSQQLCPVHTRTEAPAALLMSDQPKAVPGDGRKPCGYWEGRNESKQGHAVTLACCHLTSPLLSLPICCPGSGSPSKGLRCHHNAIISGNKTIPCNWDIVTINDICDWAFYS